MINFAEYTATTNLLLNFAVYFYPFQIGLAVGDIAEMEKKATLRRLADLTDYFYSIDRMLPLRIRRHCKIDKITCTETEKIAVCAIFIYRIK